MLIKKKADYWHYESPKLDIGNRLREERDVRQIKGYRKNLSDMLQRTINHLLINSVRKSKCRSYLSS